MHSFSLHRHLLFSLRNHCTNYDTPLMHFLFLYLSLHRDSPCCPNVVPHGLFKSICLLCSPFVRVSLVPQIITFVFSSFNLSFLTDCLSLHTSRRFPRVDFHVSQKLQDRPKTHTHLIIPVRNFCTLQSAEAILYLLL